MTTTVVTIYNPTIIPLLVGFAVAWVALVVALALELRDGRRRPRGPRTWVLVPLVVVLAFVSVVLSYNAWVLLRG